MTTETDLPDRFWVETKLNGDILAWSDNGPPALGYSPRSLAGRSLILMFDSDRPLPSSLGRILPGQSVEREGLYRPKDRGPVRVAYRIERVEDRDGLPVLR